MGPNNQSYHRKSIRLRNFDYAGNATYFLTICSFRREPHFGTVEDGLVRANEIGETVQREWLQSTLLRSELDLHSFVLMPNHLHALITITPDDRSLDHQPDPPPPGARHAPLRTGARSLGSFVGGFKGRTTSLFRSMTGRDLATLWQRGYYEHVIRSEADFTCISEYIMANPFNWDSDQENPAVASSGKS